MSSAFTSAVAESILPLSRSENLPEAFGEWEFTGNISYYGDEEDPLYDELPACQLCGYPHIKRGFEVQNRYTHHVLIVGSECVKRFSQKYTLSEIQRLHVLKTLRALRKTSCRVDIYNLIEYYQEWGAFTPKQLVMVLNLLGRYNVPHTPDCFKVKIRRQREQGQLLDLSDKDLKLIRPCLSESQRGWLYGGAI